MRKVIRFLIFLTLALPSSSFVIPAKEKVNWISIEQLNELYARHPKPIVVDIYTKWCGWCKEMDRTTYQNKKLAAYINEHYYAVKFNAESRDSIAFNGKKYGFNAQYKTNELAEFLLQDRLEYPTTVFLPSINAQPAPLVGYMKAKELEAPLKYFGEGAHTSQTFVDFNKGMKSEW